jgi:tRNA (Thr-GGU) A37 N-methylase
MDSGISLQVIGVVRTAHTDFAETPIQAGLNRAGPVIRFCGVDLLDGTPVIDLKPYVTRFDRPPGEPRCGWYDRIPISDGSTPAQLAPGQPWPI